MAISSTLWRQGVRDAYANGVANPEHRGPWGYPGTDRQSFFGFAPGKARSWTKFGKKGGMALETIEAYSEIQTETRTYTDATPTSTGSRESLEAFSAAVTIPREKILVPADIDATDPPGAYAYRLHKSATAWGNGLYWAHGLIVFYAPTEYSSSVDYDGDWFGVDVSNTTSSTWQYNFRYESDPENIVGLATEARVTSLQRLHGPSIAYRKNVELVTDLPGGDDDVFNLTDIEFLPLETNPDGETYDEFGNPQTEVYFTDTFLLSLVVGTFTGTMIRTEGDASRTEPNYDDTEPLDALAWSQAWTRSGTLILTIGVAASPPPAPSPGAWSFDQSDVNFDQTDINFDGT
jgi:hypothetical protein